MVATWPEARKTRPAWCIPDFRKPCFLLFSAWRFLRFSVCAVFRHLLCLLFGGGGVGAGLNDVLFRGQPYAAIIKSTTTGNEHVTHETTAGGGRGRRHTHPPPAGPTYERITKQPSPCKHHHQATITMQTSTPSNHHHATSTPSNHHHANINTKQPSPCNINTKQPSPCKHHHQATITMNKVTTHTIENPCQ